MVAINSMDATRTAFFSPIFIGNVFLVERSPLTSCTSFNISLPVKRKKVRTDRSKEAEGLPTAIPPKVNDIEDRNATTIFPTNP